MRPTHVVSKWFPLVPMFSVFGLGSVCQGTVSEHDSNTSERSSKGSATRTSDQEDDRSVHVVNSGCMSDHALDPASAITFLSPGM